MFREARQRSTRKQLEKDRLDPKKSHKPEPPVSGPGKMFFKEEHVLKSENKNTMTGTHHKGKRAHILRKTMEIWLQFCSSFNCIMCETGQIQTFETDVLVCSC